MASASAQALGIFGIPDMCRATTHSVSKGLISLQACEALAAPPVSWRHTQFRDCYKASICHNPDSRPDQRNARDSVRVEWQEPCGQLLHLAEICLYNHDGGRGHGKNMMNRSVSPRRVRWLVG